jgi:hypothetical protein
LRKLQAKDAIVAPAEGSNKATTASSKATNGAANKNFNAHLEDNFDGIDWARLPQYTKPLVRVMIGNVTWICSLEITVM